MRVATEVTELDYENQLRLDANGSVNVPAFRVRKSDTTVELPSGAVMMTAGLIQQTSNQVVNGLPGLMNLPILGTLVPLGRPRSPAPDGTDDHRSPFIANRRRPTR